jgi:predicted methyltransferase
MRQPLFASIAVAVAVATTLPGGATLMARPASVDPALAKAIAAPARSEANRARDKYRHPAQTLSFFGVKPTHNVVELWPGGGWYTEILAPYLFARGTYTVAAPIGRGADNIAKKLDAGAATYGKVKRANFPAAAGAPLVPDGSADVVLTFRNVHNWRFAGADNAQESFNQIYKMLKPGGVFGVVEHRLPEAMASTMEEKSGYMKRSSVVGFATRAGFRLVAESNVNANPKDTHDWPEGVWTLPPNFRLGDKDRAFYAAIGESDRMTLKFIKPAR